MKQTLSYTLHEYEVLDSTNTTAREMALSGAAEGTVITAGSQRQGRGRFGRNFFSPDGSGIYMSIVLRPTVDPLYITTAAAVAVAEAIQAVTPKTVGIKWVNDVYCDGKKVCGILTEGGFTDGKLEYAVLGIGVNVAPPAKGFPAEFASRASAVFDTAVPSAVCRTLREDILNRFSAYYADLAEKPFLEEYRRLSVLTGKTVGLSTPDGVITQHVTVQGIDDEFALLVIGEDGCPKRLTSGEVSIVI